MSESTPWLTSSWLRNWLRFFSAAGLTVGFHLALTSLASWVCVQTTPPNISPDAGQDWRDRHYVPAYADHALLYAAIILLASNILTIMILVVLMRKRRFYESAGLLIGLLPAMIFEAFSLMFMHPW